MWNSSISVRRILMFGAYVAFVSGVVLLQPRAGVADGLIFKTPFLSHDVGCPPGWLTVGDLNHDGKPDLVVARLEFSEIAVLIGNGDWTFADPVRYSIGAGPGTSPPALADLNGDGALDLVANSPGYISVLLGNNDGTFGPPSDYATGAFASSVAIGDVSGDGRPDMAFTNAPAGATVSIRIGNGDGTFGAKIDYPTEPLPQAVAIADLNGDGVADLAIVALGSVSMIPGTGGGAFGPASWSAPVLSGRDLRIGDLNGDGAADLVVASDSQVMVFLGSGSGGFAPPAEYACGGGALLLADLNGDGHLDVATAGTYLSVMLGAGDGTLGACARYDAGEGAASPAIADLNGDGKPDIIVANRLYRNVPPFFGGCPPGTVSMLQGNGDGTFGTPSSFIAGGGSPVLRDLNGDGWLDLVTSNPTAGTVSVFLGNRHEGFAANTDFPAGSGPGNVAIEDLNRDGAPDLVVVHTSSNSVSVLLGVGDGTFGPSSAYAAGTMPVSLAIADLNRDGSLDLVMANRVPALHHTAAVLLGHGDGTFAPPLDVLVGLGPGTMQSVAAGDWNGDGIPDLAVTIFGIYDQPPPWGLNISLGHGDGTFFPPTAGGLSNSAYVTVGDLDLDGRPDLVATDAGNVTLVGWDGPGSIGVLKGKGDGTFTAGYRSVGEYPVMIAIQDFDGDGKPDLAVSNSGSPYLSVLLGHGDGTFGPNTDYGAPSGLSTLASGDIDRDGRPDLIVSTRLGLMLLRNVSGDVPTPTLLSLFQGKWSGDAIELRWQFGDAGRFEVARIERGESASGPWRGVEGEPREERATRVLLDRGAEPGRTYFYRLLATIVGAAPMVFGPIEVTAGGAPEEFALLPVTPNPGHDRVRIGFSAAHPAHVRITVLDLQGRRVAQLVDEVRAPGRYEVAWDGKTDCGRGSAGLYFVRFEAAGVRRVQRFALIR